MTRPTVRRCRHCFRVLSVGDAGRWEPRLYCSPACRTASYRVRRATGVPIDMDMKRRSLAAHEAKRRSRGT